MRHLVPRPHPRTIYHKQQLIRLPLFQLQPQATEINRWICSKDKAQSASYLPSRKQRAENATIIH